MAEKVNLSTSVKAITVFALLLVSVLGVAMPIYFIFNSGSKAELITNASILSIIVVAFLPVFMYAPKKIILTDECITVRRGSGSVSLPLNQISSVELFENDALGIRTFGVGGVLGYIGKFYSKKLGHYTAYVGNCSESFLITMRGGKKYLLSCNNHREMVERLNSMI